MTSKQEGKIYENLDRCREFCKNKNGEDMR